MSKNVKFAGFKSLQRQITSLAGLLKKFGFSASYFVSKFGIDAEYFHDWLTGDLGDFAELVILYLPEDVKTSISNDITALAKACA